MSESLTKLTQHLAIIHIGASAISMIIMEKEGEASRQVEFLEQPVPLGRDIFSEGIITRATTERCVEILHSYLQVLQEYGLSAADLQRLVVTNIVAEAANRDLLLNRISVSTHLKFELLDDGEMTCLIYLKTRRRLLDTPSLSEKTTLVLHVGPGNTRVILFKKGRIVRYTSYRLGAHRTREAVDPSRLAGPGFIRLIHDHISGQISQMRFDFGDEHIENIVAIGYEIQLLVPFINLAGTSKSPLNKLRQFVGEASLLSDDELVNRYQLDFHTAEALIPALVINLSIAEHFKLNSIQIPDSDYERGLLMDLAASGTLTIKIQDQVLRHAKVLGRRYQTDPKHARHVAFLCERLFEIFADFHKLTEHDALLLQVAAYLHEIGGFISPRNHHKHSEYLILNSEIFGLRHQDVDLVAQVARYHRQSPPKPTHLRYQELRPEDQIRVSKMAALLRVADALERTHNQRIKNIHGTRRGNRFFLTLEGVQDAAVERLALTFKGQLFHDIFGLEIILQEA